MPQLAGAAAGAQRSLEDIVAQRLLAQRLQAEIAQQEQRSRLEQSTLNERIRMNDADLKRQERMDTEAADTKAASRRERDNAIGVRRMIGESITQGVTPESRRTLQGMAFGEGVDLPQELITDPTPKRIQYTYTDPRTGAKSLKFATEDQIPATGLDLGREPQKAERPPRPGTHVVGGHLVDDNGRVLFTDPSKAKPDGGPSPYAAERAQRTVDAVDRIMGKVGGWTAGAGSLLANVPGTDARDFEAELNTLKSNIAFNELAAMREASKTGGALGAVSDREMTLLQSVLGGLDSGQSPENLRQQLQQVKDSVQRWQAAGGQSNTPLRPMSSRDGAGPPASKRMRFDAKGNLIP